MNMNLIDYEIVPNGYGQIRFFPLWLANETTTLLEEWFINFKFLHFCINRDWPCIDLVDKRWVIV